MATGAPHFIDPAQLAELGDLQLLARTVVEGMMAGLHRSPHTGSSIEFAQYRPYAQGDAPRCVDWTLFGRAARLHDQAQAGFRNVPGFRDLDVPLRVANETI